MLAGVLTLLLAAPATPLAPATKPPSSRDVGRLVNEATTIDEALATARLLPLAGEETQHWETQDVHIARRRKSLTALLRRVTRRSSAVSDFRLRETCTSCVSQCCVSSPASGSSRAVARASSIVVASFTRRPTSRLEGGFVAGARGVAGAARIKTRTPTRTPASMFALWQCSCSQQAVFRAASRRASELTLASSSCDSGPAPHQPW